MPQHTFHNYLTSINFHASKKWVFFQSNLPFDFHNDSREKTFEFNSTVFRFLLKHDFSFEIEWKCNSCAKWIHSTSYACRCKCKWYVVAHHKGEKIFIKIFKFLNVLHDLDVGKSVSNSQNLLTGSTAVMLETPKSCKTLI